MTASLPVPPGFNNWSLHSPPVPMSTPPTLSHAVNETFPHSFGALNTTAPAVTPGLAPPISTSNPSSKVPSIAPASPPPGLAPDKKRAQVAPGNPRLAAAGHKEVAQINSAKSANDEMKSVMQNITQTDTEFSSGDLNLKEKQIEHAAFSAAAASSVPPPVVPPPNVPPPTVPPLVALSPSAPVGDVAISFSLEIDATVPTIATTAAGAATTTATTVIDGSTNINAERKKQSQAKSKAGHGLSVGLSAAVNEAAPASKREKASRPPRQAKSDPALLEAVLPVVSVVPVEPAVVSEVASERLAVSKEIPAVNPVPKKDLKERIERTKDRSVGGSVGRKDKGETKDSSGRSTADFVNIVSSQVSSQTLAAGSGSGPLPVTSDNKSLHSLARHIAGTDKSKARQKKVNSPSPTPVPLAAFPLPRGAVIVTSESANLALTPPASAVSSSLPANSVDLCISNTAILSQQSSGGEGKKKEREVKRGKGEKETTAPRKQPTDTLQAVQDAQSQSIPAVESTRPPGVNSVSNSNSSSSDTDRLAKEHKEKPLHQREKRGRGGGLGRGDRREKTEDTKSTPEKTGTGFPTAVSETAGKAPLSSDTSSTAKKAPQASNPQPTQRSTEGVVGLGNGGGGDRESSGVRSRLKAISTSSELQNRKPLNGNNAVTGNNGSTARVQATDLSVPTQSRSRTDNSGSKQSTGTEPRQDGPKPDNKDKQSTVAGVKTTSSTQRKSVSVSSTHSSRQQIPKQKEPKATEGGVKDGSTTSTKPPADRPVRHP